LEVGYGAYRDGRRNDEDVSSAVQLLLAIPLAAVALAASGADVARAPILRTGDHVALQYAYVGHVAASETPTDLSASFQIVAVSPSAATVTVTFDGNTREIAAVLHRDGTLEPTGGAHSDLFPQYNAIPLMLLRGAAHLGDAKASWAAGIPVKISETEWQSIPVRITSTARDAHTSLDASGQKSLLVFTHGFTVSEDVTVKGRAEFDHGAFSSAHFDVHEVVHALKDIPLSYEWTMSPQP
jgi:hypothetical protein